MASRGVGRETRNKFSRKTQSDIPDSSKRWKKKTGEKKKEESVVKCLGNNAEKGPENRGAKSYKKKCWAIVNEEEMI